MTRTELYNKALEELRNNDYLFILLIRELDRYSGFTAGFRVYNNLGDLYNDLDLDIYTFWDRLSPDFNHNDQYFIDGPRIESTNDIIGHYRDHVDKKEFLDNLISDYDNIDIDWIDGEFNKLIEQITEKED